MDVLYEKIVRGDFLTPDEWDELFKRDDAEELLLLGSINGLNFSDIKDKILTLSHPEEILKSLILRNTYFNDDDWQKFFDLSDAEGLIMLHILMGKTFSASLDVKLFDLPHASKIVKTYIIKGNTFDSLCESMLFDLPNAEEVVKLYLLKGNSLDEGLSELERRLDLIDKRVK